MRQLVKTFKALADSNRIRILKMLGTHPRPLCVCEIPAVLDLATSTVSKHLSILRDAGFILDTKDGKWVNYELNPENSNGYVQQLLPYLSDWLPDDQIIREDAQKANRINRYEICKI